MHGVDCRQRAAPGSIEAREVQAIGKREGVFADRRYDSHPGVWTIHGFTVGSEVAYRSVVIFYSAVVRGQLNAERIALDALERQGDRDRRRTGFDADLVGQVEGLSSGSVREPDRGSQQDQKARPHQFLKSAKIRVGPPVPLSILIGATIR